MYAQDNNSLPVWIILSPAHHHISTNSQPFLVGIVSLHENMEAEHPMDLPDMKLAIQKAWNGKKTGLLKKRKLVFSQDQESLRSGKLMSDPTIGSEDLSDLIISATNHKLPHQLMRWNQIWRKQTNL